MTENGRPRGATTTPAAPFTSAGRTNGESRANVSARDATSRRTVHEHRGVRTRDATVGAQHDIGIEHRDERVEVALAGSGEEGVDHLSLTGEVGVGNGRRALHPAPGPARQLPGRVRRPPHDRGDLVERHGEHVVQHERQPLRGSERVEHDQQGEADRVGEQRFVLRIDPVGATHDRVGNVHVERLLAP